MKAALEILKCFLPAIVLMLILGFIYLIMPQPPAQTEDIWDGWGEVEYPTKTLPPDHKLNQSLPYPAR